ncbi:MAG TPA: cyclase family protein [Candidatus Binataceae bacterium]|nr:cyclase family protein [Candidatus Binataceae bacterium]HVB82560.1 cyclase family protein [Candidatus Binataceae bacterium]
MARSKLTEEEIVAMFPRISNWGRWGADDQRGALNFITAEHRAAAARLVKSGASVSLSRPVATEPAADNPRPTTHLMIRSGRLGHPLGIQGSADYFSTAPHGFSETHLDALCHYFWDDKMYNGFPSAEVNFQGAHRCGVEVARDGIIGRGVLLDIPKIRGVEWLEPGTAIFIEDLEAAEREHQVRVGEGDILLVRTGRARRRRERGGWNVITEGLPGLEVSCMPWIFERRIALLGSDGVSDVMPSGYGHGLNLPVHTSTLVWMGVYLLDNADFEALAEQCARAGRYEFMFMLAPLVLEHGTASLANPLALF